MSTLLTRRRAGRSLAATAAAAATVVVAASMALLPAAPSQAATDLTLQWGISQYLNEHLTSQAFTNGASKDATNGVVTFTAGTGWHNGNASSTQYTGTARYAFVAGGSEIYSITFSDPKTITDATGEGQVVADVAWAVPSQSVAGSVTDAVVTTFAATSSTWSSNTLSATPRWAGVAGTDEYGTGKPADGKSWTVAFVKAMPSSLNPFFYASGSANDFKKPPATLIAQSSSAPSVTATTTATSPTNGVTFKVDGFNFTPVTNPGDNGVYVGLAPAGGLPDVSSMSGQSAFAAAQWVSAASISSGAFTTSLTAPTAKLDKTRSYSLYTWQAHTHSNTTQDTETPVTIDMATLFPAPVTTTAPTTTPAPAATTVATSYKVKPTATKRGKLVADLGASATGDVTVALKKGSKTKTVKATLAGGKATVNLPKLTGGTWKITVSYAGDATHHASTYSGKLTVKAAKKRSAKHGTK